MSCHHACCELAFYNMSSTLKGLEQPYRIANSLRRDVFERNWKVDQIEIDVTQAPCFALGFGLCESVFFAVVVVPELGYDEDVFTLDEPFVDSAFDALSCFSLVLVVVRAVKETISDFDGLIPVSLLIVQAAFDSRDSRCRQYRLLDQPVPSRDRSLQEACRGQKPA